MDDGLDLGRREPEREAAEAADDARAVTLPGCVGDGAPPVDGHAHLGGFDGEVPGAGDEGHGHADEARAAAREHHPRGVRRQTADVDARDAHAVGELVGRAREREADHECGKRKRTDDDG